jgi:hypothetical protein
MYKLTYIVPLTVHTNQLVTVTHPQKIVSLELKSALQNSGYSARAWDKTGKLIAKH